MKHILWMMVLVVVKTVAMDNDSCIELSNKDKSIGQYEKNNNSLDNQLEDIELRPSSFLYEDKSHTQFFQTKLSQQPFFQGKTEDEIGEYMNIIKNKNPVAYGQITQMLVDKKNVIKKRSLGIDLNELNTIDQKIQHALLQVALDNQKIATQNRGEDLEQARKDRNRSICTFVTSLIFSAIIATPGLVLSIINIRKSFH